MNMEKKLRVGILGATGMVGQRFHLASGRIIRGMRLLRVAASPRSAGKTYEEAVGGRWKMDDPDAGVCEEDGRYECKRGREGSIRTLISCSAP